MNDAMGDVIEWLDSDEGLDWASVHYQRVHGAVQGFFQIKEDLPGDCVYRPEVSWRARYFSAPGLYRNHEVEIDKSITGLPSPA